MSGDASAGGANKNGTEAVTITTGAFLEAADAGGSFRIRAIRAGLSGNGNYYPDRVLREAVPLFERARVPVKSDAEHLTGGDPAGAARQPSRRRPRAGLDRRRSCGFPGPRPVVWRRARRDRLFHRQNRR